MSVKKSNALQAEIKACTICSEYLPIGPRPVVAFHPKARIAIIGQAPGTRVHESGIPWNDRSGERLRKWMGIDSDLFYDPKLCAIVPMGFCYPGTGKSGDLPPRPECAPKWHEAIFSLLPKIELTLLIGQYAQKEYLGSKRGKNLTETVGNYESFLPDYFPMVHPSPRNQRWLKKNPWFEAEVIPILQKRVSKLL